MWKSNWMDLCSEQTETNRIHGIHVTLEMLTGIGQSADLEQQLNYDLQT